MTTGRPPGTVPGARSCAQAPRAAVPAGAAGPSPPGAAGELGSRRLPSKSLLQAQLFSTSAGGCRGSESRSRRSLTFPASSTRPAAPPRPVLFPSRRLGGRGSGVPAPAALHAARSPPAATGPPAPARGSPAAPPGCGCRLSLPQRARGPAAPTHPPRLGVSEPAAFPKPGLPVTPPRSHLSRVRGQLREGGGGRRRRGGGEGREGSGSTGGGGGAGEAKAPTWAAEGLVRREEKEGRGQRKKEAAEPPRPRPGPAPLPSHHRRLRPAPGPGVRGEGSGPGALPARGGAGAGGRQGPASGGECPAGPGRVQAKGDPREEGRRPGSLGVGHRDRPAATAPPGVLEGPQSRAAEPPGTVSRSRLSSAESVHSPEGEAGSGEVRVRVRGWTPAESGPRSARGTSPGRGPRGRTSVRWSRGIQRGREGWGCLLPILAFLYQRGGSGHPCSLSLWVKKVSASSHKEYS